MKKIYYILTIIAAALISCSDDTFDEQQTDSLTIEKAKTWFESNIGLQNLANQMRAPNNDSTDLKPLLNWEMAELDNDSVWSVVELPWEYENGIVQVSNSEVSNYATLQNDRSVIKQVIHLVILQNKKTGDRYGFKMIVVPDLQYMLEKDDAIEQNKYLRRATDLSGTVLFYSVKDEFVNGWKYEAGKITAKVGLAKASEVKWDETKFNASAEWVEETITTCYFHVSSGGGTTSGSIFDGCTVKTLTYYNTDDSGGGGGFDTNIGNSGSSSENNGGSNGGATNSTKNNTIKIIPRTNCPESALNNSNLIDKILKDYNTDYEEVNININLLRSYAALPSEHALVVDYADGQYYTAKQDGGSYITTSINTNQVEFKRGMYTVLIGHTHPNNTVASPSPSDAIAIGDAYKDGAANITANVIFANNGTEYMICVSNRSAFEGFCNNATNAQFFERAGSNFKPGTEWANQYNAVYNALMNQGFTQEVANSYALTHVLDTYNTGMKISMRSSKSSTFKEQKTEFINNKYQPTKCE